MALQSVSAPNLEPEFPAKLGVLFEPHRYKVLYGGRGGAKSWGIARALLVLGVQKPLRVLCVREIQTSMRDSVHKLLCDQIEALGLTQYYKIERDYIKGTNGTEFAFEGIRQNVMKIKSYEGIDVCWAEEAHAISEESWRVLVPTIRKADSEIWVSFNPELESDSTYKRFVKDAPTDAAVIRVSWRDNPWFPEVLRQEMEDLKARDFDAYLNVWEGNCRVILEGAVYAAELREAQAGRRISRVPYDPSSAVHTFWDLGWADCTSIWFAQKIGFETRVIDFYQGQFQALDHYLRIIQGKPYVYDTHWLPHDAKAKQLGSGRSIEELLRSKQGAKVRIVPKLSLIDGINAVRTVFPGCWFDDRKCELGLFALRHYKYDTVGGGFAKTPMHDEHSHAADAFRYLAIGLRQPKKDGGQKLALRRPTEPILEYGSPNQNVGWMRS